MKYHCESNAQDDTSTSLLACHMVSTFFVYLRIILASINIIVFCAASEENKWTKRRQPQSYVAVGVDPKEIQMATQT